MASEPHNRGRERLESLKKRLKEDPRSLEFVALAEEHNRLGEYRAAVDVAHRGLLTHPDSVEGRLVLAVAEAEQNHVREALEQIKRALIIDQENPKALALMGRILLKRGLAKRAVQFLSHAVKLKPGEEEYRALLSMAKEQVRNAPDASQVPVFSASSVPPGENPWDDESGEVPSDAEHTVFDPDELRRVEQRRAERAQRGPIDAAPSHPGFIELHEDEEPTAFLHKKPSPQKKAKMGGSAAEYSQMVQKAEADAVRAAAEARVARGGLGVSPEVVHSPESKVPKVRPMVPEAFDRGSAWMDADWSREDPPDEGRPNGHSPVESRSAVPSPNKPVSSPKSVSSPNRPVSSPKSVSSPNRLVSSSKKPVSSPNKPVSSPKSVSSPNRLVSSSKKPVSSPNKPVSSPKSVSSPNKPVSSSKKPVSSPKAATPSGAASPAAPLSHVDSRPVGRPNLGDMGDEDRTESEKRTGPLAVVGPVATRFVDEAVWGLFGRKTDQASDGDRGSDSESARPSQTPARMRPDDPEAGHKPVVVRTSEHFGTWTRAAVALVLAVAAAFIGHWVALSRAGPGPEVAGEELKGLAVDLEKGGLASLLAGEEQAKQLLQSNPGLEVLLDSILAEIYAQRWRSFGREPRMQAEARARLLKLRGQRPTLEAIAAMVELSTSAASRRMLAQELDRTLETYPESPKAWTVKARLDSANGQAMAAVEALYRALEIHPEHRRTLLELARWYGRKAAYGTAFSFFDQLQEHYPTDVEAAIDRYVLGQVSGKDPGQSDAVSSLAGLVRDEIPEVAKDETGRAALAFAIANLADGDLQIGLQELERAEAAYEESPVFQRALAEVFLALGEFERARVHFETALKHAGNTVEVRLGLARAIFGLRGRFDVSFPAISAKIRKARAGRGKRRPGEVELPFGRVRLVPGLFELVRVEPRNDIFPEAEYAVIKERYAGEELSRALEARSLIVLGDRFRRDDKCMVAVELYEEARTMGEEAAGQFGLGRCRRAAGELAAARRHFEIGLRQAPRDISGRLSLVEVLVARDDIAAALEVLEPLERDDVVSPDALVMSARLRVERGDFDRARESATRLVGIEPTHVQAWLLRGEAEYRLGRPDDAVQSALRALELEPRLARRALRSSVQLYLVARAGLIRGTNQSLRRAIAQLREASARSDAPREVRFYLGRQLVERRRTRREGLRQLERFLVGAPAGVLRDEAQRLVRRR